MPEECRDHEQEAHHAGDKYYRVMTDWLTRRRRSEEHKKQSFLLARVYHRALDVWRRCLERFPGRPMARQKLEQANSLQEMLENDLKVLATRSPQGDEI